MQVFSCLLAAAEEGKKISIELKEEADNMLAVQLTHTTFTSSNPTQDIIIRDEINRMIIEHFGGSYTILPESVCFTLKRVHAAL